MKAYLFSIGESTEELARWSLQRQGFEVITIRDPNTTFNHKYEQFLRDAKNEQWVVRYDADVIVNRGFKGLVDECISDKGDKKQWFQFKLFCMLKYETIYGCPQLIGSEVLSLGQRYRKDFFRKSNRPETAFYRTPEVNPFTESIERVVGIHGIKQKEEHLERVIKIKAERGQLDSFDMELINKVNELWKK